MGLGWFDFGFLILDFRFFCGVVLSLEGLVCCLGLLFFGF